MWKGSKLCQTILGLVSKLLHPLSELLTIVLSWVLYHVAVCAIHIAPNSIFWGFVKADVKQAEQRSLRLDSPCHESWVAVHAGINLPTWDIFDRRCDVWSKSLVMVDLKTDRCNRSWDLLWPYRVYPRLVLQAADEDRCQGWWADECVCGQQECPMQRKSNGINIEEEAICPCVSLCSRRCSERLMAECLREYWWKCGWLVF